MDREKRDEESGHQPNEVGIPGLDPRRSLAPHQAEKNQAPASEVTSERPGRFHNKNKKALVRADEGSKR